MVVEGEETKFVGIDEITFQAKRKDHLHSSQTVSCTPRLRRVSDAAASSSPAPPRTFGTKDLLSDIGQAPPPTLNSNPKKAQQQGKKNGKGKQRAMVEEVSDEEKDNIDILPRESNFIMEPKVILEPKPSVPPFVYNPIIDFADINDNNHNRMVDIGYLSSSFRPTASTTASSSSPDDFFSSGGESRYSNAFIKTQGSATTTSMMGASGGGGGGGKHARWTPAIVSNNEEELDCSPSFLGSVVGHSPPHLQTKPSLQQQKQ